MILLAFAICLAIFVGIGLASVRKSKPSNEDYYMASQSVRPWIAGLSAVATNNSGYMFIGVIGYTYVAGLAAVWLMAAWIAGDLLISFLVHRRLRKQTTATGEVSYPSVIAGWGGQDWVMWRRAAAVLTILFLGAYATAQIAAGGKALQGVLGWDPQLGAVISAGLILAYSAAGGIRASLWTDAAQSIVMMISMILLLGVAVASLGGLGATISELAAVPGYLDLYPSDLLLPGFLGMLLFVFGWAAAGVGTIGQPHIMIRFMALKEADGIVETRFWYYSYFTIFYLLATGVGLLSRIYFPDLAGSDAELALPRMAVELLPDILVGVILAGVFAATMSTADSLVLSCSAALTHDLAPSKLQRPWMMKSATALVTLGALGVALTGSQSVFDLVIFAWSALASAFGPLMILLAMGRRVGQPTALAMMALGVVIIFVWRSLGWSGMANEALPGMLVPFLLGLVLSGPRKAPEADAARSAMARKAA